MNDDFHHRSIFSLIDEKAKELEAELQSDVIFYTGQIHPGLFGVFRDFIEDVQSKREESRESVAFVLRTGGGSAETTERMVGVLRHFYTTVNFVVPETAMSAGTILCMSGDKIYMDYSSSLGPIDPQVILPETGEYVPALGYIDKIKELTNKQTLSPADVVALKSLDLGRLALYEQAKELSVELLKEWLVQFKFKNWTKHRTTNSGSPVTKEQKETRAGEIAQALSDHKRWRSHGRNLDIAKLKDLGIEIDDYSSNLKLKTAIRSYYDLLIGYADRNNVRFYMHNAHIEN